MFLILRYPQLILTSFDLIPGGPELVERGNEQARGEYRIKDDSDSNSYFKSELPGIASGILWIFVIIIAGKGYHRFVYGGQFLSGAAYMVAAWLTGLAAGWVLIAWFSGHLHLPLISENVSTAPGIDASATCYSLSKNIVFSRLL